MTLGKNLMFSDVSSKKATPRMWVMPSVSRATSSS